MMGDKCASCNQNLVNNNASSSNGSYVINLPNNNASNSNFDENGRYKLRTIQDNSYKYGTGSYSRVLSNANPNTLNDDLRMRNNASKHYINNSVHLPDINNSGTTNRKIVGETPLRRKDWSLNKEEKKDLSVGNLLNDEFDKRIMKADNLIKASNKIYDNIEKKK